MGSKTMAELNDLHWKLYERLVDLVGREEEVRLRQLTFQTLDIVNGFGDDDSIALSSGSLADGLDLKGSDEDRLQILKYVNVVPSEERDSSIGDETLVLMEMDTEQPGYAELFLPKDVQTQTNKYVLNSLIDLDGKHVLSSTKYRDQFLYSGMSPHGPCISDGFYDFANGLLGDIWPQEAKNRVLNCPGKHWISEKTANEMLLRYKCIYVPVGPRCSKKYDFLWRVSFTSFERHLTLSMNHSQLLVYGLLKIVLKEGIQPRLKTKDLLCSYYMKTALYSLIEETDNDEELWTVDNLFTCFQMCLDKLIKWVVDCNCPNYFISGQNMFFGKIYEDNKGSVLEALKGIRNGGFEELTQCESLACLNNSTPRLSDEEREARLDFMCFRVVHVYPFDSIELLSSALDKVEELYMAESHQYMKGVLSKICSTLNQEMAQMLQEGGSNDPLEMRRQQREHLLKGCGSDICSGFSLLAAFYHKQKCHHTALEILNAIIRKFSPSVLLLRAVDYTEKERNSYISQMCGQGLTLNQKLKSMTASNLVLLDNCSLIPEELKPEVQNYRPLVIVPPSVFVYMLRFLCYYHLRDEAGQHETLSMMEKCLKERYLIVERQYSTALTLFGACFETMGDHSRAKYWYEEALCHQPVCRSVQYRLQRLKDMS